MITPGPLTAAAAAELNQALRSLRELIEGLSACVSAPLGVQRTGPRFQLRLGLEQPFPAKITGGTNPYSWKEVMPGAAGAFVDVPGGGTGATNAYETGGKTDVPTGTVVEMHRGYPAADGQKYYFTPGGLPGPSGGAITVREVDLTPSISSVTILEFDQTDGYVISSPAAGRARLDFAAASRTQMGAVNLTGQVMGAGGKTFASILVSNFTSPTGDADDPVLSKESARHLRLWGRDGFGAHLVFNHANAIKWINPSGTPGYLVSITTSGGGDAALSLLLSGQYVKLSLENGFAAQPVAYLTRIDLGVGAVAYAIQDAAGTKRIGATGTFTSADGKTVTVVGGLVVSIV